MNQAQKFLRSAKLHNFSNMQLMSILEIFGKNNFFDGWIMPDGSKVNFNGGKWTELK